MIAADRILDYLRTYREGATSFDLSAALNLPRSTVRRAVQDIRRRGVEITYPPLNNGLYRVPAEQL